MVRDDRHDLEVETKGPIVEVGGADRADLVVNQDHLLVEETVLVTVELDAGARDLLEVRKGSQVDQQVIGLVRDEDADVDAARGREVEGVHDRLVGNEVGAGDPDPLPSGIDGGHEHQGRGFQPVGRAGRKNQHVHALAVGGQEMGIPVELGRRVGGPVPVLEERELDREDGRPGDLDMGVPPPSELGIPAHVFVAHVVAADPCHASVDHNDLSVVSKVDLKPIARSFLGVKVNYLDARAAKLVDVVF